jgi:hypothetical protein
LPCDVHDFEGAATPLRARSTLARHPLSLCLRRTHAAYFCRTDAAYDTHEVFDAAAARGAEVVIPPITGWARSRPRSSGGKTIRGPALRSRDERAREIEAALGCNNLNQVLAMARPRSAAIAT